MDKERMYQAIQTYVQGEIQLALAIGIPGVTEASLHELRANTDMILQYIVLELEKLES